MAIRDLIPWTKNQELSSPRESFDPFMMLHREMNRLFDDVFRGFGTSNLSPLMEGRFGWPKLELRDTDKALVISAELPGMTEKDVQIEIANGVLTIAAKRNRSATGRGNTSPSATMDRSNVRYRWTMCRKTRPRRLSRTAS